MGDLRQAYDERVIGELQNHKEQINSVEARAAIAEGDIDNFLRELEAEGFRVVVILAGHYASRHVAALEEVVEKFAKGKEIRVWVLPEYEVVTDLGYKGDHAGKWETSILMHLRPEWVDMGQLSADLDEKLEGVNGEDPRVHASPELGREIVEAIVARTAESVMDMLTENSLDTVKTS